MRPKGLVSSTTPKPAIFVHVTGLIDEIRDNDKVEFEVEQGRKGLNAVKVRRA